MSGVSGPSAAQVLQAAAARLEAAGSDEPQANAEFLLAHVLGVARTWVLVHGDAELAPRERERFERLLARKEAGEPLSHIIGTQPFFDFEVLVTPDVLTPRPETEGLVDLAAAPFERGGRYRFLDMCTGSGCIACALARRFPHAEVTAADVSEKALLTAQKNVKRLGLENRVRLLQSDLWAEVSGAFDLIVSNPPYIPSSVLPLLSAEVRREPRLALDGGEDGFAVIRPLCAAADGYLNPGGLLAVEVCKGQAEPLRRGLEEAGWKAEVKKDIFGIERFVLARKI